MNKPPRLDINLQFPRKFKPAVTTKKRHVIIIGGRGSGKSESLARLMLLKTLKYKWDILCGREYQNSIEDSVHKLLAELSIKLQFPGAIITDKKIRFKSGGSFSFRGFARNPEAVRSAQGFNACWIEEAQNMSQDSLDILLPTIRAKESQLFFTANPMSSGDPFSKMFIVPFKKQLDKDGFYEDKNFLIIVMNWRDNPWHSELEQQRRLAKKTMPRAQYDHIWEGDFNDSVENAIIPAEWFDASVDFHLKKGIKPQGMKIVSHDPSDTGPDAKGLVYRHGIVVLDVQEKTDGDVNEGSDWAIGYAIQHQVDMYAWDADGMGVSLKRDISNAFTGKKVEIRPFRGSERPENPDSLYEPVDMISVSEERSNADTFRNKRAQYYWRLRDRFFKTYRAVTKGENFDPDELISISSEIDCLQKLRSEVCRIPVKPNGTGRIQIMTKVEMKKLKIDSPNLADALMMSMEMPTVVKPVIYAPVSIPEWNRLGYTQGR